MSDTKEKKSSPQRTRRTRRINMFTYERFLRVLCVLRGGEAWIEPVQKRRVSSASSVSSVVELLGLWAAVALLAAASVIPLNAQFGGKATRPQVETPKGP